jgi:hypothetical protein|eukprot:2996007-Prymnesium_polylepis.1
MPPKRKRSSVTDSLTSEREKLQSSIERGLISIEDGSSMGRTGLGACVVVVARKGTVVYVRNIKERLVANGFVFHPAWNAWAKPKVEVKEGESF